MVLIWNILVQAPEVLAMPYCFHKMKLLLVNANRLDLAPGSESLDKESMNAVERL